MKDTKDYLPEVDEQFGYQMRKILAARATEDESPVARADGICACEGCEKPKARRNPLCYGHEKRYYKTGVLGGPLRARGKTGGVSRFGPNGGDCPIEGCVRRAESLGLCKDHYQSIVRCGMAVVNGEMVSPDQMKYGKAWLKWSAVASGRLSGATRREIADKWAKWAKNKAVNIRKRSKESRTPSRPFGCHNATWGVKMCWMAGALNRQATALRVNEWDKWATRKRKHISARKMRNRQSA